MLRSESPVSGTFTARQETPLERQFLAFILLISGLLGVVATLKYLKVKQKIPKFELF
jgi:hypothetical protein